MSLFFVDIKFYAFLNVLHFGPHFKLWISSFSHDCISIMSKVLNTLKYLFTISTCVYKFITHFVSPWVVVDRGGIDKFHSHSCTKLCIISCTCIQFSCTCVLFHVFVYKFITSSLFHEFVNYFMSLVLYHVFVYYFMSYTCIYYFIYLYIISHVCILFHVFVYCFMFCVYFYFQDYHWWWRSFLTSGFTAVYFFIYCIHYYVSKLELQGAASTFLYFGYMLIVVCLFFLLTGRPRFS